MENKDINLKEKENTSNGFSLKEVATTLLLAIVASFIIMSFFRVTVVNGHSMDNTLYDNQRLLLSVRAYDHKDPEYKDIVVIERDDLSVRYLIKRVIGVPGDTVEIKNNKLYINGEAIYEDYIREEMLTDDLSVTIPEGKIFVMGDNRNNSLDSRNMNVIGLIDYDEILGKAIFSLSGFKAIE